MGGARASEDHSVVSDGVHEVLSAADTRSTSKAFPHATSRELKPYIALPASQMRALAEEISACEPLQAPS